MDIEAVQVAPAAESRARVTVLPHEWAFGFFLWLTGLRLFLAGGAARAWSLLFLGCLAGSMMVISWATRKPTPWRWRVRLLYYPSAMGLCFYAMGAAVPLLGIPQMDGLLLHWDQALLGETPAVAWEQYLRPWLMDVSMAGYLFFFYFLIAGPGYYCVRNIPLFRKCIVGLFTLYGISFIGYTLFPAGGPHRFMTFATPLQGPLVLDWSLGIVNNGSNCVDVFPSIHFAAMLYLLWFDWRHYRRRFWWVLSPIVILWFATLYLRFHYFVDLLAGLAVTLCACAVARWYERSMLERRVASGELSAR